MSWIFGVLTWLTFGWALWRFVLRGKVMGVKTTDDKVREIRRRFDHLNAKGCATEAQVRLLLMQNGALDHTDEQRRLSDDMIDHLQVIKELEDSE